MTEWQYRIQRVELGSNNDIGQEFQKVLEHHGWDVLSVVPPENRRKNINGPF